MTEEFGPFVSRLEEGTVSEWCGRISAVEGRALYQITLLWLQIRR